MLANFGAPRFALDNLIFCESQLGAKFTVPLVTEDRRGDILCAGMDMYAQLSVCVCVPCFNQQGVALLLCREVQPCGHGT